MDSITARGIAGAWIVLMALGVLTSTCQTPAHAHAKSKCPPVCVVRGEP